MDTTKHITDIINEKKQEAIKETKKNRLVFRIISIVLLVVCSGMVGFGIDFLVNADKITGGILLGAGMVLLGSIITIKVFTEKKMATLLENIEKLGTEEITERDIVEASLDECVEEDGNQESDEVSVETEENND